MTKSDLFSLLLASMEDVGRVFDHAETSTWPSGELDALRGLGLIKEAAVGLHAPCPNCDDGHIEPVTIRREKDGTPRFFIHCPESMRVEVTAEMCSGWEADLDGLAGALSAAMDLKQRPKTLVPGRLWRLGRTKWRTSTREVILAIRLRDADAATITAHIGPGGRAIVFVPRHPPDDRIWPGHVPAVVALSRVATLGPKGIELDVGAITELVTDADAAAEARSTLPVDLDVKKQVIRQQVKAEIKGHLEDDVLVAAYYEHGSGDKASEALTKQLGRPVSRDRIYRALNRVRKSNRDDLIGDSNSVARTVASQRRDRAKKISERR